MAFALLNSLAHLQLNGQETTPESENIAQAQKILTPMIKTKSIDDISARVLKILETVNPKEVLLAFDVDMTLTQPDHPATYYPAILKYIVDYKNILETLPEGKKDFPNMLALNLPQRLVDINTPKVVEALRLKNIKMIAFTASLTGKFGNISRFEVVRYQNLKKFGLNFEDSFKDYPDISLTNCKPYPYSKNYPVFYQGILCSNGENGKTSKGDVLLEFLKAVNFSPKVVVIVDDRKKNLEDVEKSLKNTYPNTEFIGIEYQGALEYAPKEISNEEFKKFWQNLAQEALSI